VTPPAVLLDESFIDALVNPGHPRNLDVSMHYHELLDAYEERRVRLVALDDTLRHFNWARDGVLGAVDPLHVAGQHRSASTKVTAVVPHRVALTLVLMQREKVRRIATLDPTYTEFDINVTLFGADDE
jgi:hypothetical protein